MSDGAALSHLRPSRRAAHTAWARGFRVLRHDSVSYRATVSLLAVAPRLLRGIFGTNSP